MAGVGHEVHEEFIIFFLCALASLREAFFISIPSWDDDQLLCCRRYQPELLLGNFGNALGRFKARQFDFQRILMGRQLLLFDLEFGNLISDLYALNAAPGVKQQFGNK